MRVSVSSALLILAAALVAMPVGSFAQEKAPKVAILNIQQAIAQCSEGQAAAQALQAKFQPKRADLEKQQREIADLQNQLKNQEKTLSEDARAKLMRTLDDKNRIFTRDNDDATQEFQQAEQDAINEIGRKMLAIINDHAKKNGFSLILDVSSPQTPVLYADGGLDITETIIGLYNAAAKPAAGGAPAESAPKPAVSAPPKPATAAPKPAEPKPAAKP
jgi:outer membrane protein